MANQGFVYILINEHMDDLIKVGCTERSPHARAEELSKATGVPVPFQVVCYAEFDDFQSKERQLHEWLNHARVNPAREFFLGVLRDAVRWLWHHPSRLSFCDATVGRLGGAYSELTVMVCTSMHERMLEDTDSPFTTHAETDAERIAELIALRCPKKKPAEAIEMAAED